MINSAIEKYKLKKKECFLVGDKLTDIEAAQNAGINGYFFKGGNLLDNIKKILQQNYN